MIPLGTARDAAALIARMRSGAILGIRSTISNPLVSCSVSVSWVYQKPANAVEASSATTNSAYFVSSASASANSP